MTEIFHCQICARQIKASKGLIAHHGYERPGDGWQTSSCFGARFRPYEVACDAIPLAIERCEQFATQRDAFADNMLLCPPEKMMYDMNRGSFRGVKLVDVPRPEGFKADPKDYDRNRFRSYANLFWSSVDRARRQAKAARADAEALRQRLAAWRAPA